MSLRIQENIDKTILSMPVNITTKSKSGQLYIYF